MRWRPVIGGVLLAGVILATGGAAWFVRSINVPFSGWSGEAVDVVLEPGLGATTMLDRLQQAGVLGQPRLARLWVSLRNRGDKLQAGEYRFAEPASAVEVLERIERGDVLLHAATVPEGLVLEEIARRFAAAGLASEEELIERFRDPSPIANLDPGATDLEGYLFPDTYRFPRGVSSQAIVETMVARFREVADAELTERGSRLGLDLREVVVLASLIERETSLNEERPRISRVFHNRLARRMRLQCDPTVSYALHRAGKEVGRLSHAHLGFDSPWNTYRVEGLPPGPIANPGAASLWAAVAPSDGEELYFVASPDGGHRFSKDLRSHERAVAEWRRYVRSSR